VAYRLRRDESLTRGIQRVARVELRKALDRLAGDPEGLQGETVHDVRKRCKKLRGLVRLVRPALGNKQYRRANHACRDAARELSDLRETEVMLQTFDRLIAARRERLPRGGIDDLRAVLGARARPTVPRTPDRQARLAASRTHLERLCRRVGDWRVSDHTAHIFLTGDRAYKLKRAVRYDYLDFSAPEPVPGRRAGRPGGGRSAGTGRSGRCGRRRRADAPLRPGRLAG